MEREKGKAMEKAKAEENPDPIQGEL